MKKLLLPVLLLTGLIANAQDWYSVGGLKGSFYPSVDGFTVWKDKMYCLGSFTAINNDTTIKRVGQYDGTSWKSVNANITGFGIYAFGGFQDHFYIAGEFSAVNGTPCPRIAKWDGTTWTPVGTGLNFTPNPSPHAVGVYNNELYVGGGFGLAKWNGTQFELIWDHLGDVTCMKVFNNELYFGGNFNKVYKYDGTDFTQVGPEFGSPTNGVKIMEVHKNELYIGGSFGSSNGVELNNIAKLENNEWKPLDKGLNSSVNGLVSDGVTLYVAGNFWKIKSNDADVMRAVTWNGTSFSRMGTNGSGSWAVNYKGYMYSGGFQVNKWSDPLSTVAISDDNILAEPLIYPNPTEGSFRLMNFEEGSIVEVRDISGRLLQTIAAAANAYDLGLSAGVYLLNDAVQKEKVYRLVVQ